MNQYKKEMEMDGWVFRGLIDPQQNGRFFGKLDEDYMCFIDVNKDLAHIEIWYKDFDWRVKPPAEYSRLNLHIETYKCDRCGMIQNDVENLQLVNFNEKFCKDCCGLYA